MDKISEAAGIAGLLWFLGLIGLAIEDGLARWMTPSGLVGLAVSYAVFFVPIYLLVLWFYRKRR